MAKNKEKYDNSDSDESVDGDDDEESPKSARTFGDPSVDVDW